MTRSGKAKERTSIILPKKIKAKLLILSQGLGEDMSDIVREALELFFNYTKKLAEKRGDKNLLELLELAEKSSKEVELTLKEITNSIKKEIDEEFLDEEGRADWT